MEKEKKCVFDKFANHQYALSKTLRFELVPVGKMVDYLDPKTGEIKKITQTEKMLFENQVFEKDKTIDDSYNQAKFYFDTLHQKFINSALSPENAKKLNFSQLADFLEKKNKDITNLRKELNAVRNDKKDTQPTQTKINNLEKEIAERKKKFYEEICILLDKKADEWKKEYLNKQLEDGEKIKFGKEGSEEKENQKGVNFLTSAGVLQILKYEFPQSKEVEFKASGFPSLFVEERENTGMKRYIFDSFDRFSGYLTKFQETRKNIYADNGIASALATRIVDNLEIFLANKKGYENKYIKIAKEMGIDNLDVFNINNYGNYVLQNGIEALKGNESEDNSYNKIIGIFNKKIKEFRDKKQSEAKTKQEKNDFKKSAYPLFKALEKQILGKVEKEKQLIEATEIETEEEVFFQRFIEFIDGNNNRFKFAKEFMDKFFNDEFVSEYDGVFLKSSSINTISRRWFSQGTEFEKNLPQVSSKKESDIIKIKKFVTLADIKNAIEKLEGSPYKEDYYKKGVVSVSKEDGNLWKQFLSIWKFEFENIFKDIEKNNGETIKGYETCFLEAQNLKSFSKERKAKEIALVKNYADASLSVFQMMKYIALDDRDMNNLSGISADFYAELDGYIKDFEFNKYYNAFRNYITKKPFDGNKIKLNFEKGNLLGGWQESPKGNAQFCAYILRKNNDYFLAITKYPHFLDIKRYGLSSKGDDMYEKLEYCSLNWGKNIVGGQVYKSFTKQKFGIGISYQEHKEKLTKGEHVKFVKDLIDEKYIKTNKYPELKEFILQDYIDVLEMQKEFSKLQLGGINFDEKIGADWVNKQTLKEKGKEYYLYLFQVLNKDLRNRKITTSKNIHTLYWDGLFSKTNIENKIFDLLGNAEIFYRKASVNLKIKENKNGEEYINKKGEKIVEGRRYSRDIIQFHVPISLNFSKKSLKQGQFNKKINEEIAKYAKVEKVNVIGLDRGEKHLVYYSIVNPKGEIIDQGSLNEIETEINGKKVKVNYYEKLVAKEKERLESRQSWNSIGKIKDLKMGYVSQVVRKISDLAIEHDAIVVMEDLNMRFKQIRGGIERSVYQQLEKQLIDKFGYLVFKNKDLQEKGGVLNGYQLSAPFDSFEKMGKQTGIIFYTQADYTSITDPLSGFRKNIYISNSASQKTISEAIDKFKDIGWDDKEQSYHFVYNPIDFVDEKYKKNTLPKEYKVYAKVPRIRREKDGKGYWQYQLVSINEKLGELFEIWNFKNIKGNILKQIKEMNNSGLLKGDKYFDGKIKNFYHAFIYWFNLILQLRNSYSEQWVTEEVDGNIVVRKIGENVDFIASPVKPFFSTLSLNAKGVELSPNNFAGFGEKIIGEERNRIIEEFNGDANGAYNIARKGLMIIEKIKNNYEKPDLFISKTEWDKFVQK
ncbi:MAG: type V CRISPR-associated protein Cas12a/Cpf1 [bacterium]